MKAIRAIRTSLTVAVFAACGLALLTFGLPATGLKALNVKTGSMRPGMPIGSLVLMHRVPLNSLKVGDVITYTSPLNHKVTITHRIVSTYLIGGKIPGFVTKGDANQSADQPIAGGSVLGKAVWHAPYLGRIMNWSLEPIGLALIIYLPALLIVIEEVRRLNQHFRKSRPYVSAEIMGRLNVPAGKGRLGPVTKMTSILVAASTLIIVPVAHALLRSNTVSLVNNRISSAQVSGCSTNNTNVAVNGNSSSNNNVNVNNSNNQSASTGNATNSGNTNGGNATSGNASNSNCTNININIH